ncbi:MAG: amidohydrolase family protein [Nocardioidaceae bacterium]|nr:MAG: amidohydrolase family protein [Nocardioidaceae bacterium]
MTIIDTQNHWYPPAFCEAQLARSAYPLWSRSETGYVMVPAPGAPPVQLTRDFTDLDHQFEKFAALGVDVLVSSPAVFADVSSLPVAEAIELAHLINEEQARAEQAHPGSFYGLAVLPMQDCTAAISVLDDAMDRLGLRGFVLHSNVAGASIAQPELLPIYQHAGKRGVPVFLHPGAVQAEDRVRQFALDHPLSFMFDTTVAAASLILGGVLDAVPELKIVHPHLGGTLPYLIERMEIYRTVGRWDHQRPLGEYLSCFHTDTVSGSPAALAMAIDLYGADRVMFASDHPYFPPAGAVEFVRGHVDPAILEQVLSENACRLLDIDPATLPSR